MSSTFTDDSIDPDDNYVNPNINYKNRRHHTIKAEDKPEIERFSQLSYLDKEKVLLSYREGIIKFMKIWQIKDFIHIKTKVRVSLKLCYELRRIDMRENLQWYIQFAKDSYMYIGAYRKAIDEIEMYKEELWKIILYTPKGEISVNEKTNAFRELHAQTRTSVILLKELPFLTQLSKYYDLSKIDPRWQYNNKTRA